MTTSEVDTILEEEIKEIGVKEIGSSFHGTMEAGWHHVPDNHQQNLSFSDVRPANITVRNLEVEVDVAIPFVDSLKAKFSRSKVGDVEGSAALGKIRRKKILKDVSADFPVGTLTAIIGGSGGGKVRPRHPNPMLVLILIRQPSSMFSLIACGGRTFPSPEAPVTMDLPTFSQSRAPTSHKQTYCSRL